MAGKGDKPRPYDKTKFDHNYSQINWSSKEVLPELSAVQMDQLLDEVTTVFKKKPKAKDGKPKRSRQNIS